MGINQSFFTDKTYARGDQAYVYAATAVDTANQAAQDAADAIAAVTGLGDFNTLTTFFTPTQPVAEGHGDLWFDTDDGNKLYRWNGAYGTTNRTNHMLQPSAEYSSTNWTAIRGSFDVDPTILIDDRSTWRSVVSDISLVGNLNQRFEWGGSISTTVGQAWSLTCMMRSSILSAITKYKCRIVWLDAAEGLVGMTESVEFTASASDAWVKLSVSGTAPDTTTHFEVQMGPSDATQIQVSDAYWLGDVLVEQTSTPGVFFAGGMLDAAWSGTPGASTSTFTPGWYVAQDQGIAEAIQDAADAAALADSKIRTFAQTDPPGGMVAGDVGDLWVDTDNNNKLYRWDGDSWEPMYDSRVDTHDGDIATIQGDLVTLDGRVDGKATIWVQTEAPTGLTAADQGDIWIDTDNNRKAQVWSGTAWQDITDQNALDALAGLDTKITTFWSNDAPTGVATGDLWIDTDNHNNLYRWNGSSWVDVADNRMATQAGQIATLVSDLATANGRIDGKSVVWVQTTAPTGLVAADQGDIWIDTSTADRVTKVWDGDSWENITDQATLDLFDTVTSKITTWYSATAPGGAAVGDLWIDSDNGRIYRLDSVNLHGNVAYTNRITNPSLGVDATGWGVQFANGSSSTDWAQFGTQSYRVTPSGTTTDNYAYADGEQGDFRHGMVAGGIYTASVYVHVPVALTGDNHGASRTLKIVGFYHQTGGYTEVTSATGPVNGGTARLSVTMSVPADADQAFFRLYNGYTNSATNAVYFDAFMVEEGYNLHDYIDGTFAQCAWNGTAHASTSTYTPPGNGWVDVSDTRIASQAGLIATLQSDYTTLSGRVDGKSVIWVQATAPTGLTAADTGDFWIDTSTSDRVTKVWDGDSWENVSDAAALSALSQVTSKITTFWATDPPTATAIGDLWVDTNDSNKLYRASATGTGNWVLVADTRIDTALSDASTALTTANSKNKVNYSGSTPGTTANTAGDIWYQFGEAGNVTAQWIGAGGTSWTPTAMTNAMITTLDVAKLTSGTVEALLILAGKMASAQTGRRWEADQFGIRLYDADGSLLINLPTDVNTPATFKGDVVARSFTSIDQFAMRGTTNEIAKDSTLKLAAGSTAPVSPPSVLVYTNAVTITNPNPQAYYYDNRLHGVVRDGSYYYMSQYDGFNSNVYRYNATTFALDTGWSINLGSITNDGGVTVLGSYLYTLHRVPGYTTYTVSKYLLSTSAWQQSFQVSQDMTDWYAGTWPALGNDGTDLMIGYRTTGSSVNIKKFSTTGTPGTLITTNLSSWIWNVTSVNYGNFDYGSARYIVTSENREDYRSDAAAAVFAYSGSGNVWNIQTNEQWPLPGQTQGMCWDGTLGRFVSQDFSSLLLNFWSGITWTTESSMWWASTTWYDSDSAGASPGTHETDQGPRTSFTMRKRASVRITSSPIPPRPNPTTNDDVLRPRFYLGRGASDPTRTGMWKQSEVADGVNFTEQYGTVTFSGTNPPSANDFPGANPAKITSSDGTSIVLKGDGTGNVGSLTVVGGKTNLGTHVLKVNTIDTASFPGDATWTWIDWSTPATNEDSWTVSADGTYWTCPTPGTYAVYCRLMIGGTRAWRAEMWVESTTDGTMYANAYTGSHDYLTLVIPAARMSVNDRIRIQGALNTGQSTVTVADTSILLVTRLG